MGRACSRVGCRADPAVTLSYVYADRMAVVGPLAPVADPHSYDLCAVHGARINAPHGWMLVRHVHPDRSLEEDAADATVSALPDPREIRARLALALGRA